MFQTLKNAWKITELRKKILYTLFMLLIYRVLCFIPTPGSLATAMFYAGCDESGEPLYVARSDADRLRQHRILMPHFGRPDAGRGNARAASPDEGDRRRSDARRRPAPDGEARAPWPFRPGRKPAKDGGGR